MWQVFGFALFSSLPASQKKSSLESMKAVAFMKTLHNCMLLTKHIVCLQQQGHLSLFSASLFCCFSSLAIQMAIFISRVAILVLTEFYFKASGCEGRKRSSNI